MVERTEDGSAEEVYVAEFAAPNLRCFSSTGVHMLSLSKQSCPVMLLSTPPAIADNKLWYQW